jgi:hypothetical protein
MKDRYAIGNVMGNMRILSFAGTHYSAKGLIRNYDCECLNCGKVKQMTADAMRKRDNTGAKTCAFCTQKRPESYKKKDGGTRAFASSNWLTDEQRELHNTFLRLRM